MLKKKYFELFVYNCDKKILYVKVLWSMVVFLVKGYECLWIFVVDG